MFIVLQPCLALDPNFIQKHRAVALCWALRNARPEFLGVEHAEDYSEELEHGLRPNFTINE